MSDFVKSYVHSKPLTYYLIHDSHDNDPDWILINPIVTDLPIYAPRGAVAVFSASHLAQAEQIGTPLEIICLSCFSHILRIGNRVRLIILDGKYNLMIRPWRAPCESTAIYTEKNKIYYLEGCRSSGVFWRSVSERPRTAPPFISCGAFDSNGGCWGKDCPHDSYHEDDIEVFPLI